MPRQPDPQPPSSDEGENDSVNNDLPPEQDRDVSTASTNLNLRFYEARFPQVDESVLVQVTKVDDVGAEVILPEYGNHPGLILLSELSKRRIRSISKLVKVGKMEIAMVIRVDNVKGYIDLSKRRVAAEDIKKCENRYHKWRAVNSIMRHVADQVGKSLLDVNQLIAWPLARDPRWPTPYEAFKAAVEDPDKVFGPLQLDPYLLSVTMTDIRKRLTPSTVKYRADIEVQCFTYEGIEAVRAALKAGLETSTKENAVTIKLIAPPLYVMLTHSVDKDAGIAALERAIAAIDEVIKKKDGKLSIKQAPKASSAQDEAQLKNLLEEVEQENREIDGDDEDEAPSAPGSSSRPREGQPAKEEEEEDEE